MMCLESFCMDEITAEPKYTQVDKQVKDFNPKGPRRYKTFISLLKAWPTIVRPSVNSATRH